MGFAFTKINDQVVMLVDATVSAAKNTSGEFVTQPVAAVVNRAGEFYGTAIRSRDEGKTGLQPLSTESTHAIAVPLADIAAALHVAIATTLATPHDLSEPAGSIH